jgi:carboxymethylenebutenolidase
MGQWTKLTAGDGHELDAYVATPEGTPIGALVLVQEIFGLNAHIRGVVDSYAKDGFLVVAPALFDRQEKGVQIGYEGEDLTKAFGYYGKLNPETALLDVAAAYKYAESAAAGKKIGVIGFCYGGFMSWLSATRGPKVGINPAATVAYYPGGIGSVATEKPSCPVMIHIGTNDAHIAMDQIDAVKQANHPEVTLHVYEGGNHGFNCDARADYQAELAAIARPRSLEFLKAHIA